MRPASLTAAMVTFEASAYEPVGLFLWTAARLHVAADTLGHRLIMKRYTTKAENPNHKVYTALGPHRYRLNVVVRDCEPVWLLDFAPYADAATPASDLDWLRVLPAPVDMHSQAYTVGLENMIATQKQISWDDPPPSSSGLQRPRGRRRKPRFPPTHAA